MSPVQKPSRNQKVPSSELGGVVGASGPRISRLRLLAPVCARRAHAELEIVGPALLGIAQHAVRGRDRLELGGRRLLVAAVAVRVVLEREELVLLLDLLLGEVVAQAEDRVVRRAAH